MGKSYFKFLLAILLFLGGKNLFAQPTDLIFSEYIEGASNDKCVEIYNGTGAAINLSGYAVRIYFNGNPAVGATINLPNVTLNNCDVYVICHSSAQAPLIALSDLTSGSLTFNGDDAVELFNGATTADLIGNIGCDPGTEWIGVGNGTADEIIRRQSGYCTNQTADEPGTCPWSSFTGANWLATGNVADFSDIGSHTSSCGLCGPLNTITTGVIAGSPFTVDCTTGAAVNVPFVSTGTFNAGNIYTAQLSDANGNFSFPTDIGTLSSTANSGTINATIPAGTTLGTGYRIRVISDNPSVIGTDNGVDLTINGITAGTLIVNEMSNGDAGSREYMEFLVMGTPCQSVSIQHLIFDDNNGDFGAATGVASGHYRFTNDPQWGCIPSGSMIVIYNDGERNTSLPASDDIDDTSPNDSIYILPITSMLFEMCSAVPNTSGPTTTYNGCTYTAPTTWNPLGMANSGDCAQCRYADGTYMHGIGYGGATGGPDNIHLTGGTGNNFYFTNSISNDYTNVNNFTAGTAPADETPGIGNTPENIAFILSFRCNPLPIELTGFNASNQGASVYLNWSTATELNSDYFTVERAGSDYHFLPILKVDAAGYSSSTQNYSAYDSAPLDGISYYRLKEQDTDGKVVYSQVKAIHRTSDDAKPWFNGTEINLSACEDGTIIKVFDVSGKLVESITSDGTNFQVDHLQTGLYVFQVICNRSEFIFKVSLSK